MQFACAFLCLSAFAAGRDACAAFLCSAQLASAAAPASRSVEPEMAVGTVVACDRRQPCSDLSFDFGLARSCGQQDCLEHRGRPLNARRNSDGPRFHTQNDDSGDSLGSTPNVRDPSFELRRLAFRQVGCDAAARVWHASYHLAVVASDVLLGSELSEQSSSVRHGRLHSLRTPLTMLEQNWTSYLVCAQAGVSASFFARRVWSGSGTVGQRVHSGASAFPLVGREVFLKKSASVVAKDSARMVTFLTCCFSIASVS